MLSYDWTRRRSHIRQATREYLERLQQGQIDPGEAADRDSDRERGEEGAMTKPSELFAKRLRDESRFCKTTSGAVILQAVAAWLDGIDIFDPPKQELWEHVDRLCSPLKHDEGKP